MSGFLCIGVLHKPGVSQQDAAGKKRYGPDTTKKIFQAAPDNHVDYDDDKGDAENVFVIEILVMPGLDAQGTLPLAIQK
nr:hypothetical protein [uncultured Methanoregula sp.]